MTSSTESADDDGADLPAGPEHELRTATVTALTDVSVIRFDKADIEGVLDRNPAARRLLQTMIEGRAKDTFEKITRVADEG